LESGENFEKIVKMCKLDIAGDDFMGHFKTLSSGGIRAPHPFKNFGDTTSSARM